MKSNRFEEKNEPTEFWGIFKKGSPHKYNDSMIYYKDFDDITIKNKRYKGTSAIEVQKFAQDYHKSTDPVPSYGYKRDILFGEKGSRSTGKLKDF